MKTAAANPGRAPGFTLIELVLAIGISAIVLVSINSAFFGALRLRNATVEAVDSAAPLDQAATILRRDLLCTVPPKPDGYMSGAFKAGNVMANGVSSPVQLEFHTATGVMSAKNPWGEIQRVAYGLKSSGTSRDLCRTVTRNLLSLAVPDVEEQVMLRGVDQFQVFCFDGSRWTEMWDTSDSASASTNLPLAVRLVIRRSGRPADSQPVELMVPIRAVSRNIAPPATEGT